MEVSPRLAVEAHKTIGCARPKAAVRIACQRRHHIVWQGTTRAREIPETSVAQPQDAVAVRPEPDRPLRVTRDGKNHIIASILRLRRPLPIRERCGEDIHIAIAIHIHGIDRVGSVGVSSDAIACSARLNRCRLHANRQPQLAIIFTRCLRFTWRFPWSAGLFVGSG